MRYTTRRLHAAPRRGAVAAADHDALSADGGLCRACLLGVRGLEGAEYGRAVCPRLRLGVLTPRPFVCDLLAAIAGDGRCGSLPLRRHSVGHPARLPDLERAARCLVVWRHLDSGVGRTLHLLPRAPVTAARSSS